MKAICICEEWKNYWPQIEAAQMQSAIRPLVVGVYTDTIFKYCPWCGKVLLEEGSHEKPSRNTYDGTACTHEEY